MATVLVIDDHRETGVLLVHLFKRHGHTAEWAGSGAAALDYARHGKPDIALLDFMMPEMDGLDTLRKLRGLPSTASVPIVIYTAISDAKFQEFACACGANDVWTKGRFDFSEILKRVNALLSGEGRA